MTTTVVTTAAHHLRLFFLHTYASETAPADAGVQRWQVSAEVLTEEGLPLAHLGEVHLVRADPRGTASPCGTSGSCGTEDLRARLSRPDLDLAEEAAAALTAGRQGIAHGGLLFVTDVRLCPEWSGLGLGVAMCGLALRELRFGCHRAICRPERARRAAEAAPGWGYAREELTIAWPRLGFLPLAGEVLALDLTTDTFPLLVDRLLTGHDPPW